METFISKRRPKEMVKPERFYAGFEEEWKVMERYDRAKKMNHRKLGGLRSIQSGSSWCRSSILEIRSFLSLGYRQDTSRGDFLTCSTGEEQGETH